MISSYGGTTAIEAAELNTDSRIVVEGAEGVEDQTSVNIIE